MNKSSRVSFEYLAKSLTGGSIFLASLLHSLGFTPNQVSVFRFIFLVIPAGFLLYTGTYLANILALLFLFINYFFDLVDGDLARNYRMKTKLGEFLDGNSDLIALDLVYVSITLNMFVNNNEFKYYGLLLMFMFAIGVRLMDIVNSKFGITANTGNKKFHAEFSRSDVDLLSKLLRQVLYPTNQFSTIFVSFKYYLFLGVLLNIVPLMLAFYSVILAVFSSLLFLFICLYESRSRFRNKLAIISILDKVSDRK